MCTPAAGIILGITSMAQQALAIKGQNQQIYQQAQAGVNNAALQTKANLLSLGLQKTQVSNAITLDQVRRWSQGRRERSIMAARLGDAGVTGGSTVRDAVASVIQEEMDVGTLEAQKDLEIQGISGKEVSALNQYRTLVNQAQMGMSQQTTGFDSVLSILGAGVSGYSQGRMLQPEGTNWFGQYRRNPRRGNKATK